MAPVTEHQGSFLSRISRRNQVVSMDVNHDQELKELEDFQKHVAQRFTELLSPSEESDPILSIQWLRKLLDAFMSCESGFQSVLTANPAQISKPLVPETLDRIVKALDICTAVVNGVDSVRQSQRLAEIAVTALKQQPLSDGSVRRAKRALTSLLAALNADKNSGGSGRRGTTTEQSSSFGRGSGGGGCVSKNWSASKQIQAMAANLALPRGGEASPMFIMSSVMVMVMWTLVAAVPCQASNGLTVHLPLPRHQVWASAAASIQERIGEELKRKEKRCGGGGGGLMEEMQRMERVGLKLMEFADGFRFDGEEEVKAEVEELEEICRKMEDGLDGLQRQVRQVFHRLVKSRSEILEAIDHCNI